MMAQANCHAVIAEVQQNLISRFGVVVRGVETRPVVERTNPFRDRDKWLIFVLEHNTPRRQRAANQLLRSVDLRRTYAQRITDNCTNVAIVSFGLAATGMMVSVYRMPDGTVREAVYVDPADRREPNRPLPWGYQPCCL
ncbi:hypothetical protein NBE99_02710 [Thermosynechococcus sp. HN-54]|uniref:hypothetical protein n=1 Tax=Thermosynechococcus sp. HN-54 TaxID=2933959 RepID=UPI00202D00B8|nr:hypothetical protein [Thermosynechococcus sp. HN-54]URR36061.1 hypothetical protein NBE99_02710 [Thermosynechococcus sp. HN-54]